jgi:hypothetical protein
MKWNRVLLFCFGLFIASAFSMKWMEKDLLFNDQIISIFGLELFYPAEKIVAIFSGIDEKVKTILGYHLSFDFIFMLGVYPGISSLCMMAAEKLKNSNIKRLLTVFAFLQLFAWSFDIIENYYLLKWLKNPVIGKEFGFYHVVVYSKWIIALTGAFISLIALSTNLFRKRKLQIKI